MLVTFWKPQPEILSWPLHKCSDQKLICYFPGAAYLEPWAWAPVPRHGPASPCDSAPQPPWGRQDSVRDTCSHCLPGSIHTALEFLKGSQAAVTGKHAATMWQCSLIRVFIAFKNVIYSLWWDNCIFSFLFHSQAIFLCGKDGLCIIQWVKDYILVSKMFRLKSGVELLIFYFQKTIWGCT